MEYRFILEPGSKKNPCPKCGQKTFTYFIDKLSGEILPPNFGYCDRRIKCGYFLPPSSDPQYKGKNFIRYKGRNEFKSPVQVYTAQPETKVFRNEKIYLPDQVYNAISGLNDSNLCDFYNLCKILDIDPERIQRQLNQYHVKCVSLPGEWEGAVCFPFIDYSGRLHYIQVKRFDERLKTVKTTSGAYLYKKYLEGNKQPIPEWYTRYDKQPLKVGCLFGEHLLKHTDKPVALVEAPKTALIASLFYRDYLWLAVYSLDAFKISRLKILAGHSVVVFPDTSTDSKAFNKWYQIGQQAMDEIPGLNLCFNDVLECITTPEQKEKGYDLADYILDKFSEKQNTEHTSFPNNHIPDNISIPDNQITEQISIPDNPNTEHTSFPIPAHYDKALATQLLQKPEVKKLFKAFDLEIESIGIKEKINDNKIKEWTAEIATLEKFYSRPEVQAIKSISAGILNIDDIKKFADNHLQIVKSNNGNPVYRPYMERLIQLKKAIEDQLLKLSL